MADDTVGAAIERTGQERTGASGEQFVLKPKIAASLKRYRIAAFTVGVALLILVASMVLRYGFDQEWAWMWGPIHGTIYAVYVLLAFDLSQKARWRLWTLLKILLAGVVPVLSFYAEHWVTRKIRAGERL